MMEQEKIDKILRWFEKGLRIFVAVAMCLGIGTFAFSGVFLWVNGRDITVTVTGWQLALGVAWQMVKMVLMSYVVFGRWHIEYKKKSDVDPAVIGKDW